MLRTSPARRSTGLRSRSRCGDSCLLQHGADVDAQAQDGQTALHCAIVCEYGAVVDLLLEAGASTTKEDEDGETALTLARDMLGEDNPISKRVATVAATATAAPASTD